MQNKRYFIDYHNKPARILTFRFLSFMVQNCLIRHGVYDLQKTRQVFTCKIILVRNSIIEKEYP